MNPAGYNPANNGAPVRQSASANAGTSSEPTGVAANTRSRFRPSPHLSNSRNQPVVSSRRFVRQISSRQELSMALTEIAEQLRSLASKAETINPEIKTQLDLYSRGITELSSAALIPHSRSLQNNHEVIQILGLMKQVQSEITEHTNLDTYQKKYLAYQESLSGHLMFSSESRDKVARNNDYSPALHTGNQMMGQKRSQLCDFFSRNELHNVNGLGIYGNCGEMAHKTYALLKAKFPEKTIFLISLAQPGDHVFVIVSDTSDVNDENNLVVDSWANVIFRFKDRHNYLYNPDDALLNILNPDNKLLNSYAGNENFTPDSECKLRSHCYRKAANTLSIGFLNPNTKDCHSMMSTKSLTKSMEINPSDLYTLIAFSKKGFITDAGTTQKNNQFNIAPSSYILAWPEHETKDGLSFMESYGRLFFEQGKYSPNDTRNNLESSKPFKKAALKGFLTALLEQTEQKGNKIESPAAWINNIYVINDFFRLADQQEAEPFMRPVYERFIKGKKDKFIEQTRYAGQLKTLIRLCLTFDISLPVIGPMIKKYLTFNSIPWCKEYSNDIVADMIKPLRNYHSALLAFYSKANYPAAPEKFTELHAIIDRVDGGGMNPDKFTGLVNEALRLFDNLAAPCDRLENPKLISGYRPAN